MFGETFLRLTQNINKDYLVISLNRYLLRNSKSVGEGRQFGIRRLVVSICRTSDLSGLWFVGRQTVLEGGAKENEI